MSGFLAVAQGKVFCAVPSCPISGPHSPPPATPGRRRPWPGQHARVAGHEGREAGAQLARRAAHSSSRHVRRNDRERVREAPRQQPSKSTHLAAGRQAALRAVQRVQEHGLQLVQGRLIQQRGRGGGGRLGERVRGRASGRDARRRSSGAGRGRAGRRRPGLGRRLGQGARDQGGPGGPVGPPGGGGGRVEGGHCVCPAFFLFFDGLRRGRALAVGRTPRSRVLETKNTKTEKKNAPVPRRCPPGRACRPAPGECACVVQGMWGLEAMHELLALLCEG
jgi:hypothetical protein